jgi:hypothetical protein
MRPPQSRVRDYDALLAPPVGRQINHGLAVPTDHNTHTRPFDRSDKVGEVRLGIVDIHGGLHADNRIRSDSVGQVFPADANGDLDEDRRSAVQAG